MTVYFGFNFKKRLFLKVLEERKLVKFITVDLLILARYRDRSTWTIKFRNRDGTAFFKTVLTILFKMI